MLEDALAPSYLPLGLPLTGWEVKALWVPLGVWDNLEEMEISVSHSTTGPDLLYIGHESTSAPGKKKIWTTHCSLHRDRLSGGWMEHRLGTREPGARTKLPAQWQRSLLGTHDPRRAAGLQLQNNFLKHRTRGSANSQVTKACSCWLLTRAVRLSKELAALRSRGTLSFMCCEC